MVSVEFLIGIVTVFVISVIGNGFMLWGKMNKLEGKFDLILDDRKRCFEKFKSLNGDIDKLKEKL